MGSTDIICIDKILGANSFPANVNMSSGASAINPTVTGMVVKMVISNELRINVFALSIFTCVVSYSLLQFFVFKNFEVFKSLLYKRINE